MDKAITTEQIELAGTPPTVVRFARPIEARATHAADGWTYAIPDLDMRATRTDLEEARRELADRIAAEVDRLTRAWPDELSDEDLERKATLLGWADPICSEIGIDFPTDRHLLGHVCGDLFVPAQNEFRPLTIPEAIRPEADPEVLWWARVGIWRDGRPSGRVLELRRADR